MGSKCSMNYFGCSCSASRETGVFCVCHVTPPVLHSISLLPAAPMKRLQPWFRKGIDPSWMLRCWNSYLNCCLKTRRYLLMCHSGGVQGIVGPGWKICTAKASSYDWIPHPSAASRSMTFQGRVVGSPLQQQSGLFMQGLSKSMLGDSTKVQTSAALCPVILIRWVKHIRICGLREPFRAGFKEEEGKGLIFLKGFLGVCAL